MRIKREVTRALVAGMSVGELLAFAFWFVVGYRFVKCSPILAAHTL